MSFNASVNISVTPLPDNDVWFANAAAWTNYWDGITGTVEVTPAATTVYTPTAYNTSLGPMEMFVDGVAYYLPTLEMFNSLLASYTALEQSYKDLRLQLLAADLIDTAQ
jgi:hypothetical protein